MQSKIADQAVIPSDQSSASTGEISLLELLVVVARHRRLLIAAPIAAAVLAGAVSFAVPNVYKATVKVLPPQQGQSATSALLAQLGGAAGMAAGMAGLKNPSDLYVAMLNSRTIAERLVVRFGLKKVYDLESTEETIEKLHNNTSISAGKDGLIGIDVEARDKNLVAPLANAYVDELMQLTKVLAVTEAAQRRVFYERQVAQTKDALSQAEMALKGALDERGVISVEGESQVMVATIGQLRAQVAAKEIQLRAMSAFVTQNNQDYKRIVEELDSLRMQLAKLENGNSSQAGVRQASGANKQGGLANIKLLRDVKYYQMLYELLSKQYEAARLDESKDPAIIQVLDPAVAPERKSKPKRLLIAVLAAVVGLFGAISYAFATEIKRKTINSESGAAKWAELQSYLTLRKPDAK